MFELTDDTYIWFKAFHIISVITWLAGLLYLPRLFVYHSDVEPGTQQSETFKVMERKLLYGIINPSLVAVLIFGGLLLFYLDSSELFSGWLITKFILMFILVIFNFLIFLWYRDFLADRNKRSGLFYRWVNEIPAVLMIGIVIMVVVRPY